MKVALVCDWLIADGPASRLMLALHRTYPDAPIFCAIANQATLPTDYATMTLRATPLAQWPLAQRHPDWYTALMPLAMEQIDLRGFDLVISTQGLVAKGVIVDADALHLCISTEPAPSLWEARPHDNQRLAGLTRVPFRTYLRAWDVASSLRVDHFLATSAASANLIARHYRRDSIPLFVPSPATSTGHPRMPGGDHLVIAPPSHRRDVLCDWLTQLCTPTTADGNGTSRVHLVASKATVRALPRPLQARTHWLGEWTLPRLQQAVQSAVACWLPDPFDHVSALVALAGGCPIVSVAGHPHVHPETGVLVEDHDVGAALSQLQLVAWVGDGLRAYAGQWSEDLFQARLRAIASDLYAQFRQGVPYDRVVVTRAVAKDSGIETCPGAGLS